MSRIAVLTAGAPHAWIVINALVERFGPVSVLLEDPQPRLQLLRRRVRRQDLLSVVGQVGFVLLQKLIERRSRRRIAEIVHEFGLNPSPNPACEIQSIGSVNSDAARATLGKLKPDAILVIGTRIIGRETLAASDVPLINFHSGINPKYRGQAGGYWALAAGDPGNAGVTLHLVDAGVDTGGVLYQAGFKPGPRDNFSTYFWLQAAAARPLAIKAVEDALAGTLRSRTIDLPSKQYFHPTLWGYLRTGLAKGVW